MGQLSLGDITEKPTKRISHRTSYQLFRKMFLSKPDQIYGCSTTMVQPISVAQPQSTWTGAEAVAGFVGGPNGWPLRSPEFTTPLTCGDTWRSCFHTEQTWRGMESHTRCLETVVCAHPIQAIYNSRLLMHVSFNTRQIWFCRILIHFLLK